MADSRDIRVTTTRENPAGRVEADGRGKSVWRWAREKLDSTSVLLKRLDNKNLKLETTQPRAKLDLELEEGESTGGDPYNNA